LGKSQFFGKTLENDKVCLVIGRKVFESEFQEMYGYLTSVQGGSLVFCCGMCRFIMTEIMQNQQIHKL